MRILESIPSTLIARTAVVWALVFAVVHAYWAAGGAAGMNGSPADTAGEQGYIGFITVLGLVGAAVAHGLLPGSRSPLGRRLVLLARVGGAALLVGVAIGTSRWLVDGSLNGDGVGGILITAYFLVGGVLFSALGWAREPRAFAALGSV